MNTACLQRRLALHHRILHRQASFSAPGSPVKPARGLRQLLDSSTTKGQSWKRPRSKTNSRLHSKTSVRALQSLPSPVLGDVAEGLETPVQAIYLITLLGFLVVGAYLVVRQVLIRRELEDAAKSLGDRIRSGSASSEETFELGVILLRKKLFTQAVKNLEKARKTWDGEPDELAQVHNALGYAYFSMEKPALAIDNYKKAVEMQPGYVTAWNNLGNAFEKARDWKQAYNAYSEALSYAPDNKIAREKSDSLRNRAQANA